MPNISEAELASLRKAAGVGSTDVNEIAKRPYRTVKASDGQVVCVPPSEGGPLTIGGQHPDDYYDVDSNGVARKGV